MEVTPIGIISLVIFLAALVAAIRGWIPQRIFTLQTILVFLAFLILVLRVFAGPRIVWGELFTSASLHPITSTIAGFIFAGALQAAGAFRAAARMIQRIAHTALGLPFAVVLIVNLPTIFAMPCGRILAAPLIPLTLLIGYEIAREQQDKSTVALVVFGFLVNAGASCAPSLIGGLGLLGEGMGRFPSGSFSKPNQIGIIAITVFTMAAIRLIYRSTLKMHVPEPDESATPVPEHGYLAFGMFLLMLVVVVVIRPAIPIQTTLMLMTLFVMIIAKLSFKDLLGSIMLHPLSALIAGYIVAGALSVAGAFDALEKALVFIATHTFLGYSGVGVVMVFVPLFFAMPCGRILAVSLIPGVLLFGQHVALATQNELAPAVLVSSFILCSAASCGPSPLGGVGNIGEGRLRIRGSWASRPQALGILMGVPIAAALVPIRGITAARPDARFAIVMIVASVTAGAITNLLCGFRLYHIGGLLGGAVVGTLTVLL